jgi:hypothetical protein
MREFPANLPDELRQLFKSELVDPSGHRFPVTREWEVDRVEFDPPDQRQLITILLHLRNNADRTLLVKLTAEEFEQPVDVPNESRLSDLAFTISILMDEDVFSRSPSTISENAIELVPGPPSSTRGRGRR